MLSFAVIALPAAIAASPGRVHPEQETREERIAAALEKARKDPSVPHVVEIQDIDGLIFTSLGPVPSDQLLCWRVRHRSSLQALVVPGHELRILYVIEKDQIDPIRSPRCGGSRGWSVYVYGWQVSTIVDEDGRVFARAASVIDGLVKRHVRELLQERHGDEAGRWRGRYLTGKTDDRILPGFYPNTSPPNIWYDGEYVDEAYFERCKRLR